jgi:hypothetical protein
MTGLIWAQESLPLIAQDSEKNSRNVTQSKDYPEKTLRDRWLNLIPPTLDLQSLAPGDGWCDG